jgi:hypothetical protein
MNTRLGVKLNITSFGGPNAMDTAYSYMTQTDSMFGNVGYQPTSYQYMVEAGDRR